MPNEELKRSDPIFEADGWCYRDKPAAGDARKFVTLEQQGMTWVGIRLWNAAKQKWLNNNEPEMAKVIAWKDMPAPAKGMFVRGKLHV